MKRRGRPSGTTARLHAEHALVLDAKRREFARRLVWRMAAAGYANVTALALDAGLSAGAVANLVRGKSWPSIGSLYLLSAALDCSPGELLPHWDYDERCYGCESDAEICDDALCVQRPE